MKSFKPGAFIFVVVALIILVQIFEDFSGSGSSPEIVTMDQLDASLDAESLYALKPTANTWPKAQSKVIAPNLLNNNFYLVLDGSGSMAGNQCTSSGNKMSEAKSALFGFIEHIPASANVGLFVFDQAGISERVALGPLDKNRLMQAVSMAQAGGGTPLSEAIEKGYQALSQKAAEQLGYGEYNLVIVTDGEASPGYEPTTVVSKMLEESPVLVHTIGFCISGNHSLNQQGRTYYKAANDPESLSEGLNSVLAEMPDFSVDAFGG